MQLVQSERAAFGCLPGAHALQVVLALLTMLGVGHSVQVPEME